MYGLNQILLTAAAAQDFQTEEKAGGLLVVEGTAAGERTIMTPDGEKTLPFYLPVSSVGKEGLAKRLSEQGIKGGDLLIIQASFDYSEWGEGEKKSSRVRLKINRLERLTTGELNTDKAGGARLKDAVNHAVVIGNLTTTPELKTTPSGDEYVGIRVAINESWTNQKGERQEKVHYVSGTLWRNAAKAFMAQKPEKGNTVVLMGAANNESWTDKNDQKRSTVGLDLSSADVLVSPAKEGEKASGTRTSKSKPKSEASPPPRRAPQAEPDEDDNPF